jgi:hypothetical protein
MHTCCMILVSYGKLSQQLFDMMHVSFPQARAAGRESHRIMLFVAKAFQTGKCICESCKTFLYVLRFLYESRNRNIRVHESKARLKT